MSWVELAQQLGLAGAILSAAFFMAKKLGNGSVAEIRRDINENRKAISSLERVIIRIDERYKLMYRDRDES